MNSSRKVVEVNNPFFSPESQQFYVFQVWGYYYMKKRGLAKSESKSRKMDVKWYYTCTKNLTVGSPLLGNTQIMSWILS